MSAVKPPGFGARVKERRQALGLTQEALAERAGISTRTIADLERGVIRAPRRDTLDLLVEALLLTDDECQEWRQLRRELSMRTARPEPHSSLPVPPNELIGRDHEVNALIDLLLQPSTRLVTITGPGGVGKTRIALAVGHALWTAFPDGVYFIQLAAVREPDLLLPTIALHFGIRDGDPEVLMQRLMRFLAQRNMLLILDNMEQLRSAAMQLALLLAGASSLNMLATSRAGLRISAEHEFPVFPLQLPDSANTGTMSEFQRYPAIELFMQRAQGVRPDFALTETNIAAVTGICSYLEGLPLAIELAAARVKVLSPEQIIPKLADRLEFLTDGLVDAPDRHQTMRAAIGWSYDLLAIPEQRLFRQLSAFVGGWTLEAAEAVAPEGIDVVVGLTRLVNDNLISLNSQSETGARFMMLETVREFGREQLVALGERDQTFQTHAKYVLEFVERAEPGLRGAAQAEWLSRVGAETANIRAALDWTNRSEADTDVGLRLVAALVWYWEVRGFVLEGRAWLIRALQHAEGSPVVRMKLLAGAGWFAHIQQEAGEAYRCLGDALKLARELEDRWWESWILHLLGRVAYFDNDAEVAIRYGSGSVQIAVSLDDLWLVAWDEHLFGLAEFIRDDLAAARQHYERSLAIREELGYLEGISVINGLLGILMLREGDRPDALRRFRIALKMGNQIGARWLIINWIANIVFIAAESEEVELAARLAGFVESMSGVIGAFPIPISDITLRRGIGIARELLGDEEYRALFTAGQRLTMEAAIAEACAL